jgi:hypothetical protein
MLSLNNGTDIETIVRPCFEDNIHVKSRPLVAIKLRRGVPNKGLSLTKGTVSFWFKKLGAVAVEGETMVSWAPEDWLDASKVKKSTFQSVKLMHTGRLQFASAEPTGTTQINMETFETGQDSGEQKICYAVGRCRLNLSNTR